MKEMGNLSRTAWLGLVGCILGLVVHQGASAGGERIKTIYPGAGVTEAKVGQRPPQGKVCGQSYGDWEVTCDRAGMIATISIKRATHEVERNRIRVGVGLSEVFRYYGYGEKESVRGGILIRYPEQGIDFEVEMRTEKITRIIVYSALPKFPKKQYEQYQEKLKQKF